MVPRVQVAQLRAQKTGIEEFLKDNEKVKANDENLNYNNSLKFISIELKKFGTMLTRHLWIISAASFLGFKQGV